MARSLTLGLVLLALAADGPPPEGAARRLGTGRYRVAEYTHGLALAPDGRSAAELAAGGVRLLDLATGLESRRMENRAGHSANWLAFTPDGATLVAGGHGGLVAWDLATGRKSEYPAAAERLRAMRGGVAFSPSGRLAALGGDYAGRNEHPAVTVMELASGREVGRFTGVQDYRLEGVFSPDGTRLATFGQHMGLANRGAGRAEERKLGGVVQLWDLATGKEAGRVETGGTQVGRLAFAPDGKRLATADGSGVVRLWDAAAGKEVGQCAGRRGVGAFVAFSPDGAELAAASPAGVVQTWDAATGRRTRLWAEPVGVCRGLQYAGGRLLAWGLDGAALRVADVTAGRWLTPAGGNTRAATALAFRPDGVLLCGGAGPWLRRWDPATGRDLGAVAFPAPDPRFSPGTLAGPLALAPDGRSAVAGDGHSQAALIDPADGAEVCVLAGATGGPVAFAPDGSAVAAAGRFGQGGVTLIDAATGRGRAVWQKERAEAYAVACGPGGGRVAAVVEDRAGGPPREGPVLRVWSGGDGRELWSAPAENHRGPGVAFSPDGRWLAAPGPGGLRLLDAGTGEAVHPFETSAARRTVAAPPVFSPDGRSLAVAVAVHDDPTGARPPVGRVLVWEVVSGGLRRSWPVEPGPALAVAFSADGRAVAASCPDTTVLVWDLAAPPGGVVTALKPAAADDLWDALAASDVAAADAAAEQLLLQPREAVAAIRANLKPVPRPAIDPFRVGRLLGDLEDGRFAARERAARELAGLGRSASPLVRDAVALRTPSPEARRRLDALFARWDRPESLAAWVRPVRAVAVLERAGGPEAAAVLNELAAGDPEAVLTRDAAAALARLAARR